MDFCFTLILFCIAIAHPAFAVTAPGEAPVAPTLSVLQTIVVDLMDGTEAFISSIESTVGNLASTITGHVALASNTASAAAAATPNTPTENTSEAPIATNPPTPASPPIPAATATPIQSGAGLPSASPPTGAASDNIFELQSAVSALTQGVQGLTALLYAQTPSSKIENQIASLQSALASQSSQNNAAAIYPLGDGTGIAAASNIGQLSGVTISNASINAASIPDLSGSYLSLGGGTLTGALVDSGTAPSSFAGSIGIGTTTPGSLLSLAGIANFTTATSTLYGSGGFNIEHGCYAVNGTCITAGGASSQWTTSSSNIYFNTGNIGIGTTTPSQPLTIATNNASGTAIRISNTSAGGHIFDLLSSGSANTGGAGRFDIFDVTSGLARLSVQSGGNVGIGTTTPGSIFSVNNILNLTSGTSTFYSTGGINLSAGCFSINGTCVGGSSGSLSGGTAGMLAAWTGASTLTATSAPTMAYITATSTAATSTFAGAISIGNGTGQFTLSMKDFGSGVDTFAVPSLRPTTSNSNVAFDLIPNGSPTDSGYGFAWSDICDSDIKDQGSSQSTDCLHLSAASSYMLVASSGYGKQYKPLVLGAGNAPLSGNAYVEWITNGQAGFGASPYSGGGVVDITKNSTYSSEAAGLTIGNATAQPEFLAGVDSTHNMVYLQSASRGTSFTTVPLELNPNGGSVGVGTLSPYSRLQVTGPDTASTSAFAIVSSASTTEFSVFDNGNATLAGNLIQNSDQRLKTNISDLDGSSSLAAIDALNPVTFNWIDPAKSSVPQYGFIAQQVQQVFPNLISTTSPTTLTPDGTLSLNYIDLISPIVAAIQQLDKEIASIASTVAGFAQSITSAIGNFGQVSVANELCVGSTCVTPAQFQAMVAGANQSSSAPDSPSSSPSDTTDTAPVIQINGDNPAVIQVGASYTDLGATITGPQADLNLGIQTYLNGAPQNPIELDTSAAATDTIDYVVTDSQGLTSTSTRTVIVEPNTNSDSGVGDASSSNATSTGQ